jgi:Uma2 family endonuclease
MVLADSSLQKLSPQTSSPIEVEPKYLSPAEFEALIPNPALLAALTLEELKAVLPDAKYLYSDEPEMESSLHYSQLALLMACLEYFWSDRDDFFIGANLTIYYSPEQIKTRDFRGPDFFFVRGASRTDRASWVLWEESGQFPHVIIELLSESTASVDRTTKKDLYADRFKTPEYFWFGPKTLEFKGFRLINGQYEAILPNAQGYLWSQELGLFLGIFDRKLRYFDVTLQLVPTPAEAAQRQWETANREREIANRERETANRERETANREREIANRERETANREREIAQKLTAHLRSIGIDPETIL